MSYMNDGCDPFGVPYTSNFKPKKVKKVNKNDEQYWFNGAIIFKNGKRYEIWEIVDLLNEQEETINELKTRNKRQYERLKELTDLMYKRDWKTLETMVDEWEREDEYLRKYGG